jgi:hypothetical protein
MLLYSWSALYAWQIHLTVQVFDTSLYLGNAMMEIEIGIIVLFIMFLVYPQVKVPTDKRTSLKILWTQNQDWVVLQALGFVTLLGAFAWTIKGALTGFNGVIIHDLVLSRMDGQADSGHVFSYVSLIGLGLLSLWVYRDAIQTILIISLTVAIHECIWFVFFHLVYHSTTIMQNIAQGDFSYIFIAFSFLYVYHRTYKIPSGFIVTILAYLFYDIIWYMYGLPITVALTHTGSDLNAYVLTLYYLSLPVNGIEIGSWLILILGFMVTMIVQKLQYDTKKATILT